MLGCMLHCGLTNPDSLGRFANLWKHLQRILPSPGAAVPGPSPDNWPGHTGPRASISPWSLLEAVSPKCHHQTYASLATRLKRHSQQVWKSNQSVSPRDQDALPVEKLMRKENNRPAGEG